MNLPLKIRRASDGRHILGVFLKVGLERPLHKTMILKPGWPWRTQEVQSARAVVYLLRKAASME